MDRYQELAQLRREWKAPAELTTSTPREVKLTGSGIAVSILAVVFFAGAVASALFLSRESARQAAESLALRDSGIVVPGTVTRHFRSGGKDAERRITYEFPYDGRQFRSTVKTPKSVWAKLDVGSPINIRVVPGRPERNHPADWNRSDIPAWVPPLVAALLVGVGMLFIFLVRRQIRLLTEGRATPGVVTGHRRTQHGQQMLKYEFPLVEGGVGKGSGGRSRKPLAVGSTVTVVYDRDNPRRNALYPMDMVRVVR
jgi:hypothetical protein